MTGDLTVLCNKCDWHGTEDALVMIDDMRACPNCRTDEYLANTD